MYMLLEKRYHSIVNVYLSNSLGDPTSYFSRSPKRLTSSSMGPSIYYVSIFWGYFWPTHCTEVCFASSVFFPVESLLNYVSNKSIGLETGKSHLCALYILCLHKNSTERQQNWPFSRPTQPVLCWRNIRMVPMAAPHPQTRARSFPVPKGNTETQTLSAWNL